MSTFNPTRDNIITFNPNEPNINESIATSGLVGCDNNDRTQELFRELTAEATKLHGLQIIYYRQDFDPKKTHPIYGESNAKFLEGKEMHSLVDISVDSSMMTALGIQASNEITLELSYESFAFAFGTGVSPQAGDKFEIKDLLCNRPSGFTRVIFQVESQGDSDLFEVYKRWQVFGTRSDFTYIDGEPQEVSPDDVFDSTYAGPVDKVTHEPIEDDPQGQFNSQDRDLEELAMDQYKEEDSDAYGGYYSDGIYYED